MITSNPNKSNLFTNEDMRTNDDLSLPEIPTSECTPLSTTLNTPQHSDNEESSEQTSNTIDLNMPGSPIINFAHSPIKFQKGSDELQFDFQNSNEGATNSKDGVIAAVNKSTENCKFY